MPLGRRRLAAALLASGLIIGGCAPEEKKSEAPAPAGTPIALPAKPIAKPNASGKPETASRIPQGSGFDFYVLSLSWSPSYCEAEGQNANRQQCASGRPYAFVVHGLWPQFERGFPQDCPTDRPDVDRRTMSSLYDLMPASGLIRHEWRSHGACSGLSQKDYFAVLRAARERVAIPAEFRRLDAYKTLDPDDAEAAFVAANRSMPATGVAVTCDDRYLREVRICLTKSLDFRACPEIDRRQCKLPKIVMPPVRGG